MPDHVHLDRRPCDRRCAGAHDGRNAAASSPATRAWGRRLWRGAISPVRSMRRMPTAAIAYVSFNPVRARLVRDPAEWPWLDRRDSLECQADERHIEAIRRATRTGRPAGDADFYARIEYDLGRSLEPRKRGRKARNGDQDNGYVRGRQSQAS